ncbi:MAG: HAMP domain-containing histidine kinase [Bacteroidales bacterium]|nr:HAMP domain-containing histidine kinase [Bacteroidales bacterium]
MKFLDKVNRNFLSLLTTILLVCSLAGYFALHQIILNETKESLIDKENLLIKHITETDEMPNLYPILEVKKINELRVSEPEFRKIMIQDSTENELEPYLEYSNEIKVNGSFYSIKLRQSVFENEDLVIILAFSLFVILLIVFGISFFISKKMNKTIWANFEQNLFTIEHFNFNEKKKITLLESDIDEFDRLNKVIEILTEKLKTDYLSLKEFTENASHEIQTPLAVTLLNLEEVLQQDLNQETFKKVLTSINALKRLSILNQSLILLAKIENKQFKADKNISFKDLVDIKIQELTPLFESKKLTVELIFEQDFALLINNQLADILLNNLLSNAINHNNTGGSIKLVIRDHELIICNTGKSNSLTNKTIFNRFVKGTSKSYGLGLAIIKNICDTHNLEINYTKNSMHCFTITKII